MKQKSGNQLAVSGAANLAARAIARMESEAQRLLKEADALNGAGQSVQLIGNGRDTFALVRAPGITVRLENGTLAVDVAAGTEAAPK